MANTLTQSEIAKNKLTPLGIESLKGYSIKKRKAFWGQVGREYVSQFKNLHA